MTLRFDPTRAVVFDLARGQLRDDEGASRLNLPASLVLRLCSAAGEASTRDFALGLGAELGRRVTEKLSGEALSLAGWTEHVGGQLALLGLGNLSAERWGRALVLRVSGSPSDAVELLSGVLEGALLRGWSRSARLVAFPSDGSVAFLVASESTAQRARGLAEGGQGLGSVIDVLHQGGAS